MALKLKDQLAQCHAAAYLLEEALGAPSRAFQDPRAAQNWLLTRTSPLSDSERANHLAHKIADALETPGSPFDLSEDTPTTALLKMARALLDAYTAAKEAAETRLQTTLTPESFPQALQANLVHPDLQEHVDNLRTVAPGRPDTAVARTLRQMQFAFAG